MTRFAASVCWYVLVGGLAHPACAETLEEVEKQLIENHNKLKSCITKTRVVDHVDSVVDGTRTKTETECTVKWMRKGDKVLYRAECEGAGTQTVNGKETKISATGFTVVSDGDVLYTLLERDGRKKVGKGKPDPGAGGDPKWMFATFKRDYTLKLLADEKIENQDCFVIELTPKHPGDGEKGKTVEYFRKDLALLVKWVDHDKNDNPTVTKTTTVVSFNIDIPSDVFKVPEGTEVMDMTKPQP